MGLNSGQLIFLGLIFLGGMILGAAITWWLANRGKEPSKNAELELLNRLRSQSQELAGLWRSRSSGQLALRIDGEMFENGQKLSQAQRSRVQALIKEWLVWMGYPGARTAAPAPGATPSAEALVTPPHEQKQGSVSGEQSTASQSVAPGEGLPPAPARVTDQIPLTKPVERPKSIVQQINEILQEKLALSPIQGKGVRLEEDPKDGVVIWVGLERYRGVENVADPEVKALLKAAASEWEKRTGRG